MPARRTQGAPRRCSGWWRTRTAAQAPGDFELDAVALSRKLALMQQHTSLGKFRFGTPDYDRWAVVYGRVETRKAETAKQAPRTWSSAAAACVFLALQQ